MTKRTRHPTIQVFIVSWFPIYAKEAATMMHLSRERAAATVASLTQDFAAYPGHDPLIHVDRTEVKAAF